jgi:FG-GAP-like repeat
LWIYWNQNNGFNSWNKSGLPSISGLGVEVADLDRDGFLDVIVSNGNELSTDKNGDPLPGSFIYWGSAFGWSSTVRSELPVVLTRAVAVADINSDGYLDLIFGQQGKWGEASIFPGNGGRSFSNRIRIKGSNGAGTPGVADLNKDGLLDIAFAHDENVLIYYQKKDKTFSDAPHKIPVMAKTMCVADVNGDNWLDLICPVYKTAGQRSTDSYILLGGSAGYSLDNALKLPADGGTGSIVSDFNNDGFQDIFFFCHRADGSYDETGKFGDHHTNSLIYWGSKDGFDKNRYLKIPSVGAHYDVGIDIGDIKDRSFLYAYYSSPFNAKRMQPTQISWQVLTPPKTSMKFQIRFADTQDDLKSARWIGPKGEQSFYTNAPAEILNVPAGKWIQYKAVFDTYNSANCPTLEQVEIKFK